MTDLKKQQISIMLTHVCRSDGNWGCNPCPYHVFDPYGTEPCPAGTAEVPFRSPCSLMTKDKWLKWMEADDGTKREVQ